MSGVRSRAEAIRSERESVLSAARARAREIVLAAERAAESLDSQAERRRSQIDEDHRLASNLRRNAALQEEAERREASLTAAESTRREAAESARQIVDDARVRADRLIFRARTHVTELRALRERVLDDLAATRARLEPLPGRHEDESFDLPEEPDLSSTDG